MVLDEPDDAAAIAVALQLVNVKKLSFGGVSAKSQNLSKSQIGLAADQASAGVSRVRLLAIG